MLTRVATLKRLPAKAWELRSKDEHTCMFATVYAMSRTGSVIMMMNVIAQ